MGAESIAADVLEGVKRIVPPGKGICVGFSGGVDSTVLLAILSEPESPPWPISALHVHHGLSPNADEWVRFCERFCANQGVPLAVEHVRVDTHSPLGMEGAARVARYAVYAARPEPFIALAHQLDDQAETVLIQLLRGTGIKGISAMPEVRELRGTGKQVMRPLLGHSRAELVAYAEEKGLRWVEDESNLTRGPDRNFLRHDVAPLIDQRYPGWRDAIARFARHAGAASALLDHLATLDGAPERAGEPLPIHSALDEDRRANVLRVFLARNALAMPSEAQLEEMARQLYEAREDARVRIDYKGVSLLRHRDTVLIDRHLEPAMPGAASKWRVEWNRENVVELGGNRGSVHFASAVGEGIAPRGGPGEWYFAARSGGETIRLGRDRPTRTLKNLLQERAIPAWQREDFPLLFHQDRLVWVPGIGIDAEYACAEGENGFKPTWRVAGKDPLC